MYAMVCTRTDLTNVFSVVSMFMSNPGKAHWKTVNWILRYLKGTTYVCLLYDANPQNDLVNVRMN